MKLAAPWQLYFQKPTDDAENLPDPKYMFSMGVTRVAMVRSTYQLGCLRRSYHALSGRGDCARERFAHLCIQRAPVVLRRFPGHAVDTFVDDIRLLHRCMFGPPEPVGVVAALLVTANGRQDALLLTRETRVRKRFA